MARIRTIKPEFPQSETIGRLSRDARLLFVQLWTIVDDAGRARAASRMLASLLYPYDDGAPSLMDGWLAELDREKCIRRYEVDGAHYLEVINWLKHQKIDKPTKSKLPSFDEGSRIVAKPLEASPTDLDLGPGPGKDQGSEPKGSARQAAHKIPDDQLEIVGEDPTAKLFRVGKTILVSFGIAEKRTGALLGQWLKAKPDPAGVLAAIRFARDQNVAEPIAYLSAMFHAKGATNGNRNPADRALELAEEARLRERDAGLFGSDAAL